MVNSKKSQGFNKYLLERFYDKKSQIASWATHRASEARRSVLDVFIVGIMMSLVLTIMGAIMSAQYWDKEGGFLPAIYMLLFSVAVTLVVTGIKYALYLLQRAYEKGVLDALKEALSASDDYVDWH